jgi:Uma2 family endonuclease
MAQVARLHRYSFRDYLLLERDSTVRHEFLDGEIYAMAGGSVLHAALSSAAAVLLQTQLRGRCRTYSSDLRVRVPATGLTSYPDLTVICGQVLTDPEDKETATNPSLLVEVLSPATIDFDLGDKFEHYRQITSLTAVVFVWQDRRQIEVRLRNDDGSWASKTCASGEIAEIPALDCRVPVDVLYSDAGAP